MTAPYVDWGDWDDYEEDGPLDLEEQLDRALERAFDRPTRTCHEEAQRNGFPDSYIHE